MTEAIKWIVIAGKLSLISYMLWYLPSFVRYVREEERKAGKR